MNVFRIKTLSLLMVCVFLLSSCASVLPDPSQIRTEEERVDARNSASPCTRRRRRGGRPGRAP